MKFAGFQPISPQNLANFYMKPKRSPHKDRQMDLFRLELTNIIDLGHGLVKLSKTVNWERMDALFGATFSD